MLVDSRRIQKQNKYSYQSGAILYWMNRDMRIQDNWALLNAQERALVEKTELVVCYNLDPEFLGGTLRQLDFKIQALKELQKDFEKNNISFYVLVDSNIQCVIDFIHDKKIGEVITDFAPLTIQQDWLKTLKKSLTIPLSVVDTHNIVPVWEASNKKEFAAHTIRKKINTKLKDFLIPFPKLQKQKNNKIQFQKIDFDTILKTAKTDRKVNPVTWCKGGEKAAHKTLKYFIEENLPEYATYRNDPTLDVQSNLSPYLHYHYLQTPQTDLL